MAPCVAARSSRVAAAAVTHTLHQLQGQGMCCGGCINNELQRGVHSRCSTTCEQNYAAHVLLLQSRTLDTGLRMVEQGAVEALLNILRKREQKQDETQEYALRTLGNLTCMLHWGTRLV